MNSVETWALKERLPRYVQLRKGDNLLLIDLKNLLSVQMLLDSIPFNETENCILLEFQLGSNPIVKDAEGKKYANEFVFAITKEYGQP